MAVALFDRQGLSIQISAAVGVYGFAAAIAAWFSAITGGESLPPGGVMLAGLLLFLFGSVCF